MAVRTKTPVTVTLWLAPTIESVLEEVHPAPSDTSGNGNGGGDYRPDPDPRRDPEPAPNASNPGAYRLITWLGMVWIVTFFATLTLALQWRWANSNDWASIPLPGILFANTALLLLSSLAVEFARAALRPSRPKQQDRRVREARRARAFRRTPLARLIRTSGPIFWISVAVCLGLAFVSGQFIAWQELRSRGLHLVSNLGSFFFYLVTGAHGVYLLGGVIALAVAVSRRPERPYAAQQQGLNTAALYWHFITGLWLCLFALLFITIQH